MESPATYLRPEPAVFSPGHLDSPGGQVGLGRRQGAISPSWHARQVLYRSWWARPTLPNPASANVPAQVPLERRNSGL